MWSPYWIFKSNIPDNVCDQIIDCSSKNEFKKGLTANGKGDKGRKVDVKFLNEEFNWINSLMYGYAMFANGQNFKYDLSLNDREPPQLSYYKLGQYYRKHMDFDGSSENVAHTRKLSVSLQLSDGKSYDGGYLILYYDEQRHLIPKSKGTIVVFDSRITHEVTPVTRGERYSLVKWIHGDKPLA